MRKPLFVILINLFVILLIVEIAARYIICSQELMYNMFNNTTSVWLTFWQNKRSDQDDLYSSVREVHEYYGWNLKPNLFDFEEQRNVFYTTNSQGKRASIEFTAYPDSSVYRIAIIGDSYTEGSELSNGKTWGDYLEQAAGGKIEVLNFGTGGYGHDQCLLKLQREAIHYHPHLVLLGFLNCDTDRNTVTFRDYAKPRFELENGNLFLSDSTIHQPDGYKKTIFFKSVALLELLLQRTMERLGLPRKTGY